MRYRRSYVLNNKFNFFFKEVDLSPVTGGADPNIQQFEEIGNQIAESFEKTGMQQISLD